MNPKNLKQIIVYIAILLKGHLTNIEIWILNVLTISDSNCWLAKIKPTVSHIVPPLEMSKFKSISLGRITLYTLVTSPVSRQN